MRLHFVLFLIACFVVCSGCGGGSPDYITETNTCTSKPPIVSVESVEPSSGSVAGGETVTISGSGFARCTDKAVVYFGDAMATNVKVLADKRITCTTPPQTGKRGITVSVSNSVDKTGSTDTLLAAFTFR